MPRYTALVKFGEAIEEIDVEAEDYNAARVAVAVILERDYMPGGRIQEIQGPTFGMRL